MFKKYKIKTKNVKKNSTIVGLNCIEIKSLVRFKNRINYEK